MNEPWSKNQTRIRTNAGVRIKPEVMNNLIKNKHWSKNKNRKRMNAGVRMKQNKNESWSKNKTRKRIKLK